MVAQHLSDDITHIIGVTIFCRFLRVEQGFGGFEQVFVVVPQFQSVPNGSVLKFRSRACANNRTRFPPGAVVSVTGGFQLHQCFGEAGLVAPVTPQRVRVQP
ncbi:hypothetical protein SDC9_199111 [bioreactor metagenome]|uniref:Uncharacterized protein n=1 Tax=bioreactor metagenome TaxID=1076179 RepID=A0A645IJJ9_9ZZZZ